MTQKWQQFGEPLAYSSAQDSILQNDAVLFSGGIQFSNCCNNGLFFFFLSLSRLVDGGSGVQVFAQHFNARPRPFPVQPDLCSFTLFITIALAAYPSEYKSLVTYLKPSVLPLPLFFSCLHTHTHTQDCQVLVSVYVQLIVRFLYLGKSLPSRLL